jgi:hypothetical protein
VLLHGSPIKLATRVATVKTIGGGGAWAVPLAGASKRVLKVGPQMCAVQILNVQASALVVPGFKMNNIPVRLVPFGPPPFSSCSSLRCMRPPRPRCRCYRRCGRA